MMETSALAVLGIGFVLGLKHAADADHIVALTTFMGEGEKLARAVGIGLFWGLGHTVALSIAGLAVVGLRIPISQRLAANLELVVAGMLVLLGARAVASVHSRSHEHPHLFEWKRFGMRPLVVGLVHGAAGSAALTLLVLSTISSPGQAILYIGVFGAGSMIGMAVISVLLALPYHWASQRVAFIARPVQIGAGLFSCLFGMYLAIQHIA